MPRNRRLPRAAPDVATSGRFPEIHAAVSPGDRRRLRLLTERALPPEYVHFGLATPSFCEPALCSSMDDCCWLAAFRQTHASTHSTCRLTAPLRRFGYPEKGDVRHMSRLVSKRSTTIESPYPKMVSFNMTAAEHLNGLTRSTSSAIKLEPRNRSLTPASWEDFEILRGWRRASC